MRNLNSITPIKSRIAFLTALTLFSSGAGEVTALNFTSQTTVNTTTHVSTLYLQGTAGRVITIEKYGADFGWISAATVTLSPSGTGSVNVSVDEGLMGDHRYEMKWLRYSLFRASERDNPNVRSPNAFAALYGALEGMVSASDEVQLGNPVASKSLSELIRNPVNGQQVAVKNSQNLFNLYTYDDIDGDWTPSVPTISVAQGFWIRGLNSPHSTIVDASALYDEQTISIQLLGNGFENLISPEHVQAMESYGNMVAGSWLDIYDASLPAGGTTSTLPQVPGAQMLVTKRTGQGGSGVLSYITWIYDDLDQVWLSTVESTGIPLLRGVYYRLPAGSPSQTWSFNHRIW